MRRIPLSWTAIGLLEKTAQRWIMTKGIPRLTCQILLSIFHPPKITLDNDIFSAGVRGEKKPTYLMASKFVAGSLLRSFVLRFLLANSSKMDI